MLRFGLLSAVLFVLISCLSQKELSIPEPNISEEKDSFLQTQFWTESGSDGWESGATTSSNDDCIFFCRSNFWYDIAALILMALVSPSGGSTTLPQPIGVSQSPTPSYKPPITPTPTSSTSSTPSSSFVPLDKITEEQPPPPPCECSAMNCPSIGSGIWGFGDNAFGQLGMVDRTNVFSPIEIPQMKSKKINAFSFGWEHGIATIECGEKGNVVCRWGKHNFNRLGGKRCFQVGGQPQQLEELMQENGNNVTLVAAGRSHTLALSKSKTGPVIYGWGNNFLGQLGTNSSIRDYVFNLPAWAIPTGPPQTHFEPQNITTLFQKGTVKEIHASSDHSAILFESGDLYMWGRNNYGQCGQGHEQTVFEPLKVKGTWKSVALGYDFTVALDEQYNVWVWGDNARGQLGLSQPYYYTSIPIKMDFFSGLNIRNISAGWFHGFAWGDKGAYVWGNNEFGQLGVGNKDRTIGPIKLFENTVTVYEMCGGRGHSAAITSNSEVYTWGQNDVGQLGISGVSCKYTPNLLPNPRSDALHHVACGYDNTFVW